jgi:hypothetical protein
LEEDTSAGSAAGHHPCSGENRVSTKRAAPWHVIERRVASHFRDVVSARRLPVHPVAIMPKVLTLAVSQTHTLPTLAETLSALEATAHTAARKGAHIICFPEAYLGSYPRGSSFGSLVGSHSPEGREQFLRCWNSSIDLGDTPRGAGDRWVQRRLPAPKAIDGEEGIRGDGTRERLEKIARETGVFLVVGVVERAGGSLYCSVAYVCPRDGCLGKRRNIMPVRHPSGALSWFSRGDIGDTPIGPRTLYSFECTDADGEHRLAQRG